MSGVKISDYPYKQTFHDNLHLSDSLSKWQDRSNFWRSSYLHHSTSVSPPAGLAHPALHLSVCLPDRDAVAGIVSPLTVRPGLITPQPIMFALGTAGRRSLQDGMTEADSKIATIMFFMTFGTPELITLFVLSIV
jgi:hypothetical protein